MGEQDSKMMLSIPIPQAVVSLLETLKLNWLVELWYDHPIHLLVESVLVILILYILFKRPSKKKTKLETLPAAKIQELIDEFEPDPLCPEVNESSQAILDSYVVLEEKPGKYTKVEGVDKPVLNLVTMDFCGLGQRPEITEAAHKALDKYGCGSCGPRGFYGSIDVHVFLEKDLANFFGTEEAIMYSDASSTASSAIPAFSNRADLLVVDDGCNESILTGVNLSRSRVLFFKHNDMASLEAALQKVADEDKRLQRKPQRRFIIVEGLYRNYGDIAPLDQIFALKKKYKWRLFLDESHSVGMYGATGRGVAEHFNIPLSEVDLCVSSLSTAIGSVGGFCIGTREVVEHQRLSGAGYCFSASSPPFVSTAASASLKLLEKEGKTKLLPKLRKNCDFVYDKIMQKGNGVLEVTSAKGSALVHVRLDKAFQFGKERADYDEPTRFKEEAILREIVQKVRQEGFLLTVSNYILTFDKRTIASQARPELPPPTIRMSITTSHDEAELSAAIDKLVEVTKQVLDQHKADYDKSSKNENSANIKKRK